MKTIPLLLCGLALAAPGFAEPETLTLERALELARTHSPGLRAARLNAQAAGKAVAASGRWTNPVLDFEAEGIGGDLDGFNETEYTLSLWQTMERGGKRRHDRAVAVGSSSVALHASSENELALLADVRMAFIEVYAWQEIARVRAEQEELGRAFVDVAKRRYESGGGSELDVVEAQLALDETVLEQLCCTRGLMAERIRLASLIGIPEPELGELEHAYDDLPELDGTTLAQAHPSLQRLDAEIGLKRAEAARAKAGDASDITLGAGYRYDAESDMDTIVLGAQMPLNLIRKGRAAEAALLLQAEALQAERSEMDQLLRREWSSALARYDGARREAEVVRDRLVPKAERAYALCKEGYDAGRFSWYEPINAQKHLTEIRIREIEALRRAHQARAELSKFIQKGSQP